MAGFCAVPGRLALPLISRAVGLIQPWIQPSIVALQQTLAHMLHQQLPVSLSICLNTAWAEHLSVQPACESFCLSICLCITAWLGQEFVSSRTRHLVWQCELFRVCASYSGNHVVSNSFHRLSWYCAKAIVLHVIAWLQCCCNWSDDQI